MDRLLVTGGAGFIGSNFVHHLMEHTDVRVTVLDKMTYAASREALAGLPEDRVHLVVGDIAEPDVVDPLVAEHDAVVHYAAESHNDNSLHDPSPFIRHQHHRHLHAARGGPQARQAPPPRLDRRGLRRPRARRPRGFTEHALQPVLPYSRPRPARPPGPRVGPHLRRAGDGLQLLQQLRPLAAHREVHPPPDHQRHRRHPPKLYGSGENVRDWIHADDHSSAVWTILNKGEIGETYLIGADGEKNNSRSSGSS